MAREHPAKEIIRSAPEPANQNTHDPVCHPLGALVTLGLSHRTAGVEVRGRLAVPADELEAALHYLQSLPGVAECMLLSTCNRTEVYAIMPGDTAVLLRGLAEWFGLAPAALRPYLYEYRGAHSAHHLFRVASGLDSAVLGEAQILGQIKRAFARARACGCAGPMLGRLGEHAQGIAKGVRTRTGIGRCPVSLAGTATAQIQRVIGAPPQATALVIGAGENAELVVRHLVSRHVGRLRIANRGLERARRLAGQFGARAFPLERLEEAAGDADVIISTTGAPGTVLSADTVRAAVARRGGRPLLLLDLAVPADIEAAASEVPGAVLLSADDLGRLAKANLGRRQTAAREAEGMIERAVQAYAAWLRDRTVVPTIRALRAAADEHRRAALARARRHLRAGRPVDEVLESMSRHLANRMLNTPLQALHASAARREQQSAIAAASELFALDPDVPRD